VGAADLPRRPLALKFLYVAIVLTNAYQHTKFQLSSSISFGDMRGSQIKKWELLISPDVPYRTNFLYRALVRVNAYKYAKFQLPSSTSFRDKEYVLKYNVGATTPCCAPYAETFVCAEGTWQGQTACQMSASYLHVTCIYANMYFP